MAYSFNTDLLLSDADQEEARREYPRIAFGLDHPSLRETFAPIDARANEAKTRSRHWGVFAVALATLALMLAAAEMLYHDLPKTTVRVIAALGGIAGIVSVIIGVFGVMYRERKMRWLADRMQTEQLRQFHFNHYAAHAEDILAGAKDPAKLAAYEAKREKDFVRFQEEILAKVDHELHEIAEAEGVSEELMVAFDPVDIDPNDPDLDAFFQAYERLRFERQIAYCDFVLGSQESFWKQAPVRQARILGAIAMACVMGILVLHALVLLGAMANIAWMKGPLVHVVAVCAAILALSARTLEEGFQPEREIERMRQYRLSLRRIYDRFKVATTPQDKILAMRDLEKLTYEEMVLFLRSNYEAKFVM